MKYIRIHSSCFDCTVFGPVLLGILLINRFCEEHFRPEPKIVPFKFRKIYTLRFNEQSESEGEIQRKFNKDKEILVVEGNRGDLCLVHVVRRTITPLKSEGIELLTTKAVGLVQTDVLMDGDYTHH